MNWNGKYIERYVKALYSNKHIPALLFYNDKYFKIYKVRYIKKFPEHLNKKYLVFKCNDGYIKVINYEKNKKSTNSVLLKNYIIKHNNSILNTLKIITKNQKKACVVTKNKKFLKVVTDGDIRRGLIRGLSLNDNIENS